MLFSDGMLATGAGLVECGVSAALILVVRRSERWRPKAVVILGALTPLFLLYAVACLYSIFVSGLDKTGLVYLWAVFAVGFVFYAATALLGFAASFLDRPVSLWLRFALGLSIAPVACGAIVFVTR